MKSNNIYQAVWYDKEFRNYGHKGQLLWLFMMTNANAAGVFDFDEGIFSYVTKIDEEEVPDLIKSFEDRKKVVYDRQTSEVFLLNHFKYNNPANSTKRHKVRFNSDFINIKSSDIKAEVKKKAGPAIKASEKVMQSPSRRSVKEVKEPHIDK